MATVRVGTSGWSYPGWRHFYPSDLPSAQRLAFYAGHFPTTEVNYSFYHLPRPSTYQSWAEQVPDDFVFAVKASWLITHTKRLQDVDAPWKAFIGNAASLGSHLGPVLFQFPASFQRDLARLRRFLRLLTGARVPPIRPVFEFRHESCFTEDVYRLLTRHQAALCIVDSPRYPRRDVLTAEFAYFRFHGRTQMFVSSYTEQELAKEARLMRRFVRDRVDVYAYFNNDAKGHAVGNARRLQELVAGRPRRVRRGVE
ncbi:MAG: DUF72 domain-containing protein [Nitrospirales bacterium]